MSSKTTLAGALRQFAGYPSPWILAGALLAETVARVAHGHWGPGDLAVPAVMLVSFPFFEWIVHTSVLHWKPRRIGRLRIDPLLARKHREHHADPRRPELIFIPLPVVPALVVGNALIGLLAFPGLGQGLTFMVCAGALGVGYEWTHFLVHSDYRPRSRYYKAVWRNHRLHHFKNEHYWFTVTSSGTADRVLGTNPDPASIPTSRTAKNLHAAV
jgi:hypothetical protein